MKRNITYNSLGLTALLFSLLTSTLFAQTNKIDKANKEFENLAYIKASKIYEQVALSGFQSPELFQKLGDSHYFNANYKQAVRWYQQLFSITKEVPKEYFLRYSQALKASGNNTLSKTYYDQFLTMVDNSNRDYADAEMYLNLIKENSNRYTIKKEDFNSDGIDFGASFYGEDKIVFASTRDTSIVRRRVSAWDGLPFLDLFEVNINDSTNTKPKKIKGKVNSKYHESTMAFSKDGKTVYFTRNNSTKNRNTKNKNPDILKIYRAEIIDDKWVNIEDLSINGDNYSTAHPALSPDESRLYFVSDRPGGFGQTDIYFTPIDNDGKFGKAINLGPKINTSGKESFPFISSNYALYFSSEGHYGLGGYDVFYVKLKGYGYEGNILNVGTPINSQYDDICYTVTKDHKGLFSSNRVSDDNDSSFDNIYSFIENEPIKNVVLSSSLSGTVLDQNTKAAINEAIIEVYDTQKNLIAKTTTNTNGNYFTEVPFDKDLVVKVTKDTYNGDDAFSVKAQKNRVHNFELTKDVFEINKGDDLAKILNIKIYFDLNKHKIRPDAQVELQKLIQVLNDNPNLKIDIRSHTDSRANDQYNYILSNKRAKATMDYLIAKGINPNRLTARGYGETFLVNPCVNGVDCDETQHQQNRRSEFIILK